jgi:hypothetical protein
MYTVEWSHSKPVAFKTGTHWRLAPTANSQPLKYWPLCTALATSLHITIPHLARR